VPQERSRCFQAVGDVACYNLEGVASAAVLQQGKCLLLGIPDNERPLVLDITETNRMCLILFGIQSRTFLSLFDSQ
jgi:hypothetical protein